MGNNKDDFLHNDKRNMTVKAEGRKIQQYICAIIASVGAFIIGSVLAWTSPGLLYLNSTDYSAPFQIKSHEEGDRITAFTPIGAVVGAIPAGMFADAFGRKPLLIAFTLPWIGTWILMIIATHVYYLYAARFVSGIIAGTFCSILPMYINEIAQNSVRGTLGTLFQLFLAAGILFVYILALFKSYTVLCYSALGVTIAFFVIVTFIPETPTYYIMKQRRNEAERSLRRLRGSHYDVQSELHELSTNLEIAATNHFSARMLLTRANIKALIISTGLMLCQQFSGINAVLCFAETIFSQAKVPKPELCPIVVGITQVLATAVSSALVDRAGRKILLLVSSAGMSVGQALLGYYFWVAQRDENAAQDIRWLPLVSVVLLIIVFSLGLGPLPWIMFGEILAPEIKSFGTTVTVIVNWTSVSMVTFSFQPLMKLITTAYTFWLFSAWCVLATVFVLVVLPETKNKSIEEIQNVLAGKKPSHVTNDM